MDWVGCRQTGCRLRLIFLPAAAHFGPEPAESGNRHKKSKVFSNWMTRLRLDGVYQFLWHSTRQLPRPNRPSQCDNVLVAIMGNGKAPDIARIAGLESLVLKEFGC